MSEAPKGRQIIARGVSPGKRPRPPSPEWATSASMLDCTQKPIMVYTVPIRQQRVVVAACTLSLVLVAGGSWIASHRFAEQLIRHQCEQQLGRLCEMKLAYRAITRKSGAYTPTYGELLGASNRLLAPRDCPKGGSYRIGSLNEPPSCPNAIDGHAAHESWSSKLRDSTM
jgi:hypothetical protein